MSPIQELQLLPFTLCCSLATWGPASTPCSPDTTAWRLCSLVFFSYTSYTQHKEGLLKAEQAPPQPLSCLQSFQAAFQRHRSMDMTPVAQIIYFRPSAWQQDMLPTVAGPMSAPGARPMFALLPREDVLCGARVRAADAVCATMLGLLPCVGGGAVQPALVSTVLGNIKILIKEGCSCSLGSYFHEF